MRESQAITDYSAVLGGLKLDVELVLGYCGRSTDFGGAKIAVLVSVLQRRIFGEPVR